MRRVTLAVVAISALLSASSAPALPGLETLEVSYEQTGSTCTETLDPKTVVLKESKNDILVIEITNDCSTQRELNITYYPKPPQSKPNCVGQPSTAVLGSPFKVGPNSEAFIVCTVAFNPASMPNEKFKLKLRKSTIHVSEIALDDVP